MTGDCYQTLGVHPAIGRLLAPSDDKFDGPKVAVLGYRFWKTELGGNPNVLGSTIKISGVPFRIIGVTEARFEGLIWGYPASVSAPISQRTSVSAQDPSGHFYWAETLARLRSGVGRRNLEAELKTKWRRLLDAGLPPGFKGPSRAELTGMPPVVASGTTGIDYYFREHFENALFALLAISILVLIASCVNVANLLLARGLQRQREIGVRLAIGGARWRIVRQLLVESAILLAAGLGFAFILALISSRLMARFLIAAFAKPDIYFTVALDWRVLLFTGLAGMLAVLIFAIVPAWRTSDVDPVRSLKGASRSVSGSRAAARKILLTGQVAITFVILVGASVFSYSIAYLRGRALSLNGDTVLNAQLMPVPQIGSKQQNADSYFRTLLDRIRSLPGVRNVSLTSFAPLVSAPYKEDIRRLDRPDKAVLQAPAEFVTDGFLKIMHIPLLQGRDFRATATEHSQRTTIVSESVAERLFPEGHALGRHIQFGTEPETRNLEIVGIAADRPLEDPHLRNKGFLLLNLWQLQRMGNWGNLQVQFSGSVSSLTSGLRSEIERAGQQQVFLLSTMSELRERSLLQDRLLAGIGKIYVFLVLVLVALGLVGLLLFFVSSREREIAIRVALGAERRDIKFLVAREAAWLTGTGMLVGLPFSYAVIHGISGLVYGVSPTLMEPVLFSLLILSAVAILAILGPMHRASRIEPSGALRDG